MTYIAYFFITLAAVTCALFVFLLILLIWFYIKHRNDFTNTEDW